MRLPRNKVRKYLRIRWDIQFRKMFAQLDIDQQLDCLMDQLIVKGSYHYHMTVT